MEQKQQHKQHQLGTTIAGKNTNDVTTSSKVIPKAGTKEFVALVIIGIIVLIGVIKFVKYKDIELK